MSRTIGAQHVLQQKTYAVGPSPPPVEMFSPRPLSNVVVSPSALLAEVGVISYVSYPVVHGGGKVRELLQRQGAHRAEEYPCLALAPVHPANEMRRVG